jgi:NAD(P)-dependent dehydrogenase (short-subunit alcohol dehydrogenase family)
MFANTSSIAGAAYTASKHGLIGLTKNTGAFYGSKGIRCNVIAAGAMATGISHTLATGGVNMEGLGRMRKNCKFANVPSSILVYMCSHTDDYSTIRPRPRR